MPESGRWRLLLWTAVRVVDHIRLVLGREGYQVGWDRLRDGEPGQWAYALTLDRPLDGSASDFLTVLSEVLVLTPPTSLASAIALDFYKSVVEGRDATEWPNTQAGECVNRMKYWSGDPEAQESALLELTQRMSTVIQRHPVYRAATILQVPGHDSSQVSWGERLAQSVASVTTLPVVSATAQHPQRDPAKTRTEHHDLQNEFSLGAEIAGRTVIIVDDTYGQGDTVRGMAAAAQRAHAQEIHALFATRNVRK
jgi:pyrimidine operon attenuation protein/uracil phosphoribosyltransferase